MNGAAGEYSSVGAAADFDLDLEPGRKIALAEARSSAARTPPAAEMCIIDRHGVKESHAMVHAAYGSHGHFFQTPRPGVVLRVSRICSRCLPLPSHRPRQGRDAARRWTRFKAVRSRVSRDRAGPLTTAISEPSASWAPEAWSKPTSQSLKTKGTDRSRPRLKPGGRTSVPSIDRRPARRDWS